MGPELSYLVPEFGETRDGCVGDEGERRAAPRDERDRFAPLDGDPERRVRPLDREDIDPNGDRSSLVRADLAVVERGQQRLEASVESLALGCRIDPEPLEFEGDVSTPDTEVQAPVTEAIYHRVLFGQLDRAVEREHAHHGPQADALGPRGAGREEHRGRGTDPARLEVVLGDPQGRESSGFHGFRETDHVREPIRTSGGTPSYRVDHRERAELHAPRDSRRVEGVSRGREPGPPRSMAHRPKG